MFLGLAYIFPSTTIFLFLMIDFHLKIGQAISGLFFTQRFDNKGHDWKKWRIFNMIMVSRVDMKFNMEHFFDMFGYWFVSVIFILFFLEV